MLYRSLIAALALAASATDSEGGPLRRRAQASYYQPAYQPVYQSPTYAQPAPTPATAAGEYTSYYTPATTTTSSETTVIQAGGVGTDALDEVNAQRAARGLRPFLRDEGLTQGARACAAFRAERGLFGHTSNDFAFVPAGTYAVSGGCAAYPAGYGWMSCCVYDNYTYAGAAYVTGRDGRRYMQLFVR